MSNSFLVKHYRVFYALVLAVSILLLGASHYVEKETLFKSLLHELGFAGIIAVILIFTIEAFNRERHQISADTLLEKINTDLFRAIYKRYIPEKVFEEVEKCVMRCNVFRSDHALDYTIDTFTNATPDTIKNDYFHCTAQTAYKLSNLLEQKASHEVIVQIELPIDKALCEYCKIEEVKIDGRSLTAVEIKSNTTTTDSHLLFKKTIELPVKGSAKITTKSSLLKKKTDSEVWCSRLPSDGLTLTVSTPSKGLIVNAFANHSEKLDHTLNNHVTQKWMLDYGIFPHQSIIFWWKFS